MFCNALKINTIKISIQFKMLITKKIQTRNSIAEKQHNLTKDIAKC